VMDHVVHRDAQGVGISQDHHTQRVADQDDVRPGGIDDLRTRIVVRGEHADALRALHGLHGWDGDSFGLVHSLLQGLEEKWSGGLQAAGGRKPAAPRSVSVLNTSGSKRYVVLRSLLRISNLLHELI